jgi:hypothetical protein
MTVANQIRKDFYNGNSVSDSFPVTFGFFELNVYVDDVLKTEGVHYDITQANPGETGTIVFKPGHIPPSGTNNVAFVGTTEIIQSVDYEENSSFPAEVQERALDRLTMIVREQTDRFSNVLRVPDNAQPLPELDIAGNPSTFLYVNPSGVPELAPITGAGSPISAELEAAVLAAQTAEDGAEAFAVAADTSADNAAASAVAAAASALSASNLYDSFDDRYLGSKASDPTLDNDGNALLTGAIYWNTTLNKFMVWNGTSWQDAVIMTGVPVGGSAGQILKKNSGTNYDVGWGFSILPAPQGRLSLTSGVAVTTADVTAATAIYLVPANGNWSTVYNGTDWVPLTFSGVTLTLSASHAINTNYDVFDFIDAGVLNIGTGPAWSTNTSRGTGAGTTEIELFEGRIVNKNAITLRNGATTYAVPARQALLRGTFRTIGTAGQTEDSRLKRYLSNVYNPVSRQMYQDSLSQLIVNYTYSTSAMRQANGSTDNAVRYVQTLAGREVNAEVAATVSTSDIAGPLATVGIGIDSTSQSARRLSPASFAVVNKNASAFAAYTGDPGIGFHEINWLEQGNGTGTQTWVGYGGGPWANSGIEAHTVL